MSSRETPKPRPKGRPKKTDTQLKTNSPYCGIDKIPSGRKEGTMKECLKSKQVRKYGLIKIDNETIEEAKKED